MADLRLCPTPDCGKPVRAAGLCEAHYRKKRRYGDPLHRWRRPEYGLCSVDGCTNSADPKKGGSRGWCSKHYDRWHHHGDPTALLKTPGGELAKWLIEHSQHSTDDCLIWPFGKGPKGYASYAVVGGVKDYAHRHMCALAHGPAPSPKHEVAHNCGKGLDGCVNPRHLRWDTHISNMADRLIHGTHGRGERCSLAKLTESDVREIRLLAPTMLQREIAAKFGVHRATVGAILSGKSWFWLP